MVKIDDWIFSWTCPYCRQIASIKGDNLSKNTHKFRVNNLHMGLYTCVIFCPNSKCGEFTMDATLYSINAASVVEVDNPLIHWNLKPQSSAIPFPEYIPASIRQDYEEACLICGLSPKASATLARRCLQGIIRDFWGIIKSRLFDEIKELEDKIDPKTWQAIDAVRSIGNIGAHMEKDINLIVDVEPEEAELLLRLIEVLLKEWYINRYEREEHMQKIIAAAQAKKAAKNSGNP